MKVLIDIDRDVFEQIKNQSAFFYEERRNGKTIVSYMYRAIKEGTEVPECGRLIDADAYRQSLLDNEWDDEGIHNLLDEAPTVIEPNRGGDES